jgi:hypothetical protein
MWFREADSGRLRASVRGLVPVVVTFVALPVGFAVQGRVLGGIGWPSELARALAWILSSVGLYGLLALVALWVASRLDRRPYTAYGLDVDRSWLLNFAAGTAISVVAVAVSVWYADARGLVDVAIVADETGGSGLGSTLLEVGLVAVVLLSSNVYEEVLYRGIVIQNFAEGLQARGLSSTRAVAGGVAGSLLLFGVFHLLRGPLVALDATLVGVTFALAYVVTGELGLAIGVHFGRVPMALLVQGESLGVEVASMEAPTEPAPYLEFTLLQLGLVGVLLLLWAGLQYGRGGVLQNVSAVPADGPAAD